MTIVWFRDTLFIRKVLCMMIIELTQQMKELFDAAFLIHTNLGALGSFQVHGRMIDKESTVKGMFNARPFQMDYAAGMIIKTVDKKFCPYQIYEAGAYVGEIYQEEKRTGLFSRYRFHTLFYGDQHYVSYEIGMGTIIRYPIYLEERQIALLEKETTVHDALHHFKIYVKAEEDAYIAVLFACYTYIKGYFRPGIKMKKSIEKGYTKTFNKELLSKYDPDWIKDFKQ